jgi:hypothetical protein
MSERSDAIRRLKLRKIGERDARAGKPIEAFYDVPLVRHTEALRASYEIGYRAPLVSGLENGTVTLSSANAARLRVAKLLHKAADIADEHELLMANGGIVGSILGAMAWEIEEQAKKP